MEESGTVIVVEDDPSIADLLNGYLRKEGYRVLLASDGTRGLELFSTNRACMLILDISLPGELDGLDVCREVRKTSAVPIIMLTARDTELDKILGLELGADDYVTKPFSMKVLMARVAAVLRRKVGVDSAQQMISNGPMIIDPARHEITLEGRPISVTPTEFKLLSALANARGRVLSRDQLTDRIMGAGVLVTDRAIDVHVTAVRKKLGDWQWMVHTVRGVGYRLLETREEEG